MAGPNIPRLTWPGLAAGFTSFTYSAGHGTMPGRAVLITNPQPVAPALAGDLAWTCGNNGVRLTDCRCVSLTASSSLGGKHWVLVIEDRRWKWRFGVVNGVYNELDPYGKLVPWKIRSPVELAVLCLKELGETNYLLTLPPGLTRRDGRRYAGYLATGTQFPDFGTNPVTRWNATPAAAALSQLAGKYGCRVMLDPVTDRVLVVPGGGDVALPVGGSINTEGITLNAKPVPRAVIAVGDDKWFQMKLRLEAVLPEYDGKYVPIEVASYAPKMGVNPQDQEVTIVTKACTGLALVALVDGYEANGTGAAGLTAALQANVPITKRFSSITQPTADTIRMVAENSARNFHPRNFLVVAKTVAAPPVGSYCVAKLTKAFNGRWGWQSTPPAMAEYVVTETDRLTRTQAAQLAKNLYRYYRIADAGVGRFGTIDTDTDPVGSGPIYVPGYGKLKYRLQLKISDKMLDQIVPTTPDDTAGRLKAPPNPIKITDFAVPGPYYTGKSQDQPARVYGSYCSTLIGDTFWKPAFAATPDGMDLNTPLDTWVRVGFSVDPVEQLVIFDEPVYRVMGGNAGGAFEPADLILECAVRVENAETNAIEKYLAVLDLGGPGPQYAEVFPDLQSETIGRYKQDEAEVTRLDGSPILLRTYSLKKVEPVRTAETARRAAIYLDAMARQFQTFPATNTRWNGVVKVGLTGSVQQVTWEIGPGGVYTTASSNSEHDFAVPSYGARKLPEALPPAMQLAEHREAERPPVRETGLRLAAAILGGAGL